MKRECKDCEYFEEMSSFAGCCHALPPKIELYVKPNCEQEYITLPFPRVNMNNVCSWWVLNSDIKEKLKLENK